METLHEDMRRLCDLIGLPRDGRQLVPSDAPVLTHADVDWGSALTKALSENPYMRLAAWELFADQLKYAALAGPPAELARSYEKHSIQESKVARLLALSYRHLVGNLELAALRRAQREAFGEQLDQRFQADGADLDRLVDALRLWVDSGETETTAIVDYRKAVANFAFATGDFLSHAGFSSIEDLTPHAAARALEREQKRTESAVRREAAKTRTIGKAVPGATDIQEDPNAPSALSLPALWKAVPPLKEAMPSSPKDKALSLREWQVEEIFPTATAKNQE